MADLGAALDAYQESLKALPDAMIEALADLIGPRDDGIIMTHPSQRFTRLVRFLTISIAGTREQREATIAPILTVVFNAVKANMITRGAAKSLVDVLDDIQSGGASYLPKDMEAMIVAGTQSMPPRWCCVVCRAWTDARCKGCGVSNYCNAECQRADWRSGHREACAVLARRRDEIRSCVGDPDVAKAMTDVLVKSGAAERREKGLLPNQKVLPQFSREWVALLDGRTLVDSFEFRVPLPEDGVAARVRRQLAKHTPCFCDTRMSDREHEAVVRRDLETADDAGCTDVATPVCPQHSEHVMRRRLLRMPRRVERLQRAVICVAVDVVHEGRTVARFQIGTSAKVKHKTAKSARGGV